MARNKSREIWSVFSVKQNSARIRRVQSGCALCPKIHFLVQSVVRNTVYFGTYTTTLEAIFFLFFFPTSRLVDTTVCHRCEVCLLLSNFGKSNRSVCILFEKRKKKKYLFFSSMEFLKISCVLCMCIVHV